MTEKWYFRALFCQISSDGGGLDASDGGGGCSPLASPLVPPLLKVLGGPLRTKYGGQENFSGHALQTLGKRRKRPFSSLNLHSS